jgi:hypothetical protein
VIGSMGLDSALIGTKLKTVAWPKLDGSWFTVLKPPMNKRVAQKTAQPASLKLLFRNYLYQKLLSSRRLSSSIRHNPQIFTHFEEIC